MTRKQPFAAAGTAFLLVLFSACTADSVGPGAAGAVSDRFSINIGHIDVIHDCDPAWDNPGDFQGYVEIWQDMNPALGNEDYELVAASPKRTILLNSGESASGHHIRAEATVPRLRARPVMVRGVFHELDNGVADAGAILVEVIGWSENLDCWQIAGACLPTAGADEYYKTWTMDVHTRDDVWNLFNSDDEGCKFNVTFVANIGES